MKKGWVRKNRNEKVKLDLPLWKLEGWRKNGGEKVMGRR